ILIGQLTVHQADDSELQRHFADLFTHGVLYVLWQRVRRQRARGVSGVHTTLLAMLHAAADHHSGTVGNRIDNDFDGVVEEVIEQHRCIFRCLHSVAHIGAQLFLGIHDFHRTTAQYVGRTHHQRVFHLFRHAYRLVDGANNGIRRLTQTETLDHLLET